MIRAISGIRVLLLSFAFSFAAGACGGGAEPSPTPEPTSTPPPMPFTIRGPLDQQAALAQGWDYSSTFVLEPATGLLHVIDIDATMAGQQTSLRWLDDTTLLGGTAGGAYRITLDGDISIDPGGTPVGTWRPYDAIPSADGAWSASRTGTGLLLTEEATGRTLDVPFIGPYDWAPAGHRLVAGGGWCGNGRVVVVDPDGAGVIAVTEPPDTYGVVWYWRPDGAALALDVHGGPASLVLVDATTGEVEPLVPIAPARDVGEIVPQQWNPSGTHLLFRIQGGRDCSD